MVSYQINHASPAGNQTDTRVLPQPEIILNPNPRANENIVTNENARHESDIQTDKAGSEITDGEDG